MKRWVRALAVSVAALLLPGCAGRTEGAGAVSLFAVNVGKGDALLVQTGDYVCLIDAGKAYARGKILAAMSALDITALDAVFITHPDDDHVGGLEWLADSDIPVGAWYASGIFTEVSEEKHPAAKAAQARGDDVRWLTRGDSVPLGDTGAVFTVLAPFETFTDKDDNNSLVMLLESPQGRMLFTGDMELPQEASLLAKGDDLSCAVLKAPNHGDDDTLSATFATAAEAQIAVISTDSQEKPGTPDPGVVSRLKSAGSAVCVTQDAGLGIRVVLADGAATAEGVDIDAAPADGVYIDAVDAKDDRVTLANRGADRDLTGWYLYSDPGDEIFAFPKGFILKSGASVTVGTNSTDGGYDLLWDDEKVIRKNKPDVISLYDNWGRRVDAVSNGN